MSALLRRRQEDWTPLPDATNATGEEPLTPGLGKGRKGGRGSLGSIGSVSALQVSADKVFSMDDCPASPKRVRTLITIDNVLCERVTTLKKRLASAEVELAEKDEELSGLQEAVAHGSQQLTAKAAELHTLMDQHKLQGSKVAKLQKDSDLLHRHMAIDQWRHQVEALVEQEQEDAVKIRERREHQRQIEVFQEVLHIPFFYFPVFYTASGCVQSLTGAASFSPKTIFLQWYSNVWADVTGASLRLLALRPDSAADLREEQLGKADYLEIPDPPGGYDGVNPQSTFKPYLRDLELWQAASDVPEEKQGLKLVQVLTGAAKAAVDTLTVKEIKGAEGYPNVKKLKEAFEPFVETALPRAMENAFYGQPRGHKEGVSEFLVRFQRAQAVLKDEGITLPTKAAGYLLFRQANLDSELEARLVTWLAGDYSLDTVLTNLRRLERVTSDHGKKIFFGEEEDPENEPLGVYGAETVAVDPNEDDDDDENWVYLEEGQLDGTFDEDEVLEALATYQQVRKQIKEQKLGRQFFKPGDPSRGKGYGGSRPQGKHGFRPKMSGQKGGKGESRRIHIEQLKLRTRCRNCGQLGHWSRECKAPLERGRAMRPPRRRLPPVPRGQPFIGPRLRTSRAWAPSLPLATLSGCRKGPK
eukprot:s637_g2.t1